MIEQNILQKVENPGGRFIAVSPSQRLSHLSVSLLCFKQGIFDPSLAASRTRYAKILRNPSKYAEQGAQGNYCSAGVFTCNPLKIMYPV